MSTQNRTNKLLRNGELETFSKTASMASLCLSLVELVNSPSRMRILAEVRDFLPRSQRNKFVSYCNDLLKSECLGNRGGTKKRQSKLKMRRVRDQENQPPKIEGNPLKRRQKTSEINSKKENRVFKNGQKSSSSCGKEKTKSVPRDRKLCISRHRDNFKNKIIVLQRPSLRERFGFKILGGHSSESPITVDDVTRGSLAEKQGLKKGHQLIRVNDIICGKRGVDVSVLMREIKAAKELHMQIASSDLFYNDQEKCRDVSKQKAVGMKGNSSEDKNMFNVTLHPLADGWLGCWIRG